ncbi:helix-turn-helix transcriptional regulator (plasmid) [Rhizobium sp. CB3171]|uniref:helix-turn-helix transcriptional regulator n=1 Tax=Rhizobium sp. CB3171 TaxID=3039157 RepID=UPI0024B05034|nr:helix-turn-helix transcriptional regulator [Rhizobium sp. CB3171]WFU04617.1 helix-turn-helix transcriptional regulator [Rhizobium sp. CB3171]
MTGILIANLNEAALNAAEIVQWLSAKKGCEAYRPVSSDCRALFSFSVHTIDGFGGWSGSSSAAREFLVDIESDDFMFFVEHGTYYQLSIGGARHLVTPSWGLVTSADRYSGVSIGSASVAEGFCVPRSVIVDALVKTYERSVPTRFEFEPLQNMTSGPAVQLLNLIRFFKENTSDSTNLAMSPIALASFKEMFSLLMVQNLRHSLSEIDLPVHAITPRQIKRAADFARAHFAMPITVSDMAAAAGVSTGALHLNFRRFLNITPMGYLQQLRLEGVRRDLIEASPSSSIAEIARRWGFVHLGRFSHKYRIAFGVLPSVDLARQP